mmetsp:Transcript_39524/g.62496  ORF Transcript_39524/g.62496 Transcript_39524/m.62496 type:complete len:206 (-) Transcript_39524:1625-2242(-)
MPSYLVSSANLLNALFFGAPSGEAGVKGDAEEGGVDSGRLGLALLTSPEEEEAFSSRANLLLVFFFFAPSAPFSSFFSPSLSGEEGPPPCSSEAKEEAGRSSGPFLYRFVIASKACFLSSSFLLFSSSFASLKSCSSFASDFIFSSACCDFSCIFISVISFLCALNRLWLDAGGVLCCTGLPSPPSPVSSSSSPLCSSTRRCAYC